MEKFGIIVLFVLYLLSPIDLAPEIILGPFGFIDDAAIGLMALRKLVNN